jgi:hypothetical protein
MNIIITIVAIVGSVVIAPVVAMNVPPIREALFGMVSKESILTLADKVDTSRIENERKLSELQETVSAQQKIIDEDRAADEAQKEELRVMIESQQSKANEQENKVKDLETNKDKVNNQTDSLKQKNKEQSDALEKLADQNKKTECVNLKSSNIMCDSSNYRKKLSVFLDLWFKQNEPLRNPSDSNSETKELVASLTKNYGICQDIYKKCD